MVRNDGRRAIAVNLVGKPAAAGGVGTVMLEPGASLPLNQVPFPGRQIVEGLGPNAKPFPGYKLRRVDEDTHRQVPTLLTAAKQFLRRLFG